MIKYTDTLILPVDDNEEVNARDDECDCVIGTVYGLITFGIAIIVTIVIFKNYN